MNDDILVFELSGNLMGGDEVDQFQAQIHRIVSRGHTRVVMDLHRVHMISSSGIGMMVWGVRTIQEAGGHVRLARAHGRIHKILVDTNKLDDIFDIVPDIDEAIAQLQQLDKDSPEGPSSPGDAR